MAKKKKKAPIDVNETFKNGMYKQRTKQATLQGLLLFGMLCLLGVISYIVSMLPAGIFGVIIAKSSTGSQLIYDIQNLVNVALGLAVLCIGGSMFAKMPGENDALEVFQNGFERKLDVRYIGLSVIISVLVFMVVGVVLNIDFVVGPVRYLSIFLCRAERKINEGLDIPFWSNLVSMIICMAAVAPCLFLGAKKAYNEKMTSLVADEDDVKEREETLKKFAEEDLAARRNAK